MSLNEIEQAVKSTIRDSEFQSLTTDIAEVLIDSNMEDGILKDVPGLSILISAFKTTNNVKGALMAKKLVYFLTQLKDIPAKKRKALIDKIDNSEKYRTRVAEKLLFIIDKCQDAEKAELVGKLFKAFLNEELNYEEFLRASESIERIFILDLLRFVDERWGVMHENDDYILGLMNAGLVRLKEVNSRDAKFDGTAENDILYSLTELGNKMRIILSTKPFTDVYSIF